LASALAVVVTRHAIHAALWFITHLLCLACIYGLLNAPLLAVLQVMVYAGAVMVLFLFAIMILDASVLPPLPQAKGTLQALAGVLGALCLLAPGLAWLLLEGRTLDLAMPAAFDPGSTVAVARVLFGSYLYPFELVSILLLVALIAIMVLASRKLDSAEGRP
jgi:NADH-quinone oxidoreductase subunit J